MGKARKEVVGNRERWRESGPSQDVFLGILIREVGKARVKDFVPETSVEAIHVPGTLYGELHPEIGFLFFLSFPRVYKRAAIGGEGGRGRHSEYGGYTEVRGLPRNWVLRGPSPSNYFFGGEWGRGKLFERGVPGSHQGRRKSRERRLIHATAINRSLNCD